MTRKDGYTVAELINLVIAASAFGVWQHSIAAGFFLGTAGLLTMHKWGRY